MQWLLVDECMMTKAHELLCISGLSSCSRSRRAPDEYGA